MYKVKEIYLSLQGEGFHTGRRSVFCRFNSCNLWSGEEKDRASAICNFCDTNFVGLDGPEGGAYENADQLAEKILHVWNSEESLQEQEDGQNIGPFIVLTGGEPLLHVDENLITALKSRGCVLALETNGSIRVPRGIDWITVSPKAGAKQKQTSGDELKLVYPQELNPKDFEEQDFAHFYLSPKEVKDKEASLQNIWQAMHYCQSNPKWKLSLQYHKLIGIP